MRSIKYINGFRKACENADTKEYLAFQKGRLEQEAILRKSILTLARQGSSPAQTLAKKIHEESAAKNLER